MATKFLQIIDGNFGSGTGSSYPIEIKSFTASPNVVELGSITTITLDWTLNKNPTELFYFDPNMGGFFWLDPSLESFRVDDFHVTKSSFEPDEFTLKAYDNDKYVEKSIKLSIGSYGYYGTFSGDLKTLDESTIKSGHKTKELIEYGFVNKPFNFYADAGEDEYIYFAYQENIDGFPNLYFKDRDTNIAVTFNWIKNLEFINDYGITEWYGIYVTNQKGLGPISIQVGTLHGEYAGG